MHFNLQVSKNIYAVVEFIGEESVEIVPASWIENAKEVC